MCQSVPASFGHKIRAARFLDDRLEFDISVATDSAWFAGHFPNNPVLPGIAAFEMLRQAYRMACDEWHISRPTTESFVGIRLKQVIAGPCEMTATVNRALVSNRRQLTLVANGSPVATAAALPQSRRAINHPCPPPGKWQTYAAREYLPHAKPMLMVDETQILDDHMAKATAQPTPHWPGYQAQGIGSMVAVELMAQVIGSWIGRNRIESGRKVNIGYLVGIKLLNWAPDFMALEHPVNIDASRVVERDNYGVFLGRVHQAGSLVMEAELQFFEPDKATTP